MNLLKSRILAVFFLISAPFLSWFPATGGGSSRTLKKGQNVFMMGWDGAGLINVNQLLKDGRLPNLKRFLETGGHIVPLEPHTATSTVAEWTEFLKKKGVYKNMGFWIDQIPYKHTVPHYIQKRGCNLGWFTSKYFLSNDTDSTPLAAIANAADGYEMLFPSEEGDGYIGRLTEKAVNFMKANDKFFVFLHVNPDTYGHKYGENSERYLQEFVNADHWFGEALKDIDRETTYVIVMADHGFDEGEQFHKNAPDLWMATDMPVHPDYFLREGQRAFGSPRDVAVTLMSLYGVDKGKHPLQLRGKSLLE